MEGTHCPRMRGQKGSRQGLVASGGVGCALSERELGGFHAGEGLRSERILVAACGWRVSTGRRGHSKVEASG